MTGAGIASSVPLVITVVAVLRAIGLPSSRAPLAALLTAFCLSVGLDVHSGGVTALTLLNDVLQAFIITAAAIGVHERGRVALEVDR